MNNDISIRPAYLDQLGPEDAFADIHGFVRPPRISMLNDRFNPLDENGDPALPPSLQLQVIMLQENDTRIYYPAGEYEPDSAVPPSCYSDDKIRPSESAQQPQHPTCAGCPRSIRDLPSFNGKTTVSACKERYKVACLVAGAKGKVFLLDIGPASRRAYGAYFNFLKQHHAKANQVITRLDYADKAFGFSFEGWIEPRVAELVKQVYETDEPAMVVNAFDRPKALPAPNPANNLTQSSPIVPPPVRAPEPLDFGAAADRPELPKAPARRGRPPKDAAPPTIDMFPSTPPAASAAPSIPAKPGPVQMYNQGVLVEPKNNGGGFGMETAQAPPQNIQEALNRAFGP